MKVAWLHWYDREAKDNGDKPELYRYHPGHGYNIMIVYCEVEDGGA